MNGRTFAAIVLLSSALATHARAQVSEADRTAARDLYVEGSQLQQQGHYAEALDRFQRSLAVFPTAPTTAFRIAQCKMALGQLVEAAEELRLVATQPLPQGANQDFVKAKNDATAELAALEPRIPKLRVNVLPAGVQGLSVTIDNVIVPSALVGVARPVNPGSHKVIAGAPGYSSAQAQVDVRERQQPIPEVTLTLTPGAAPQTNPTGPIYTNAGPTYTNGGYQYPYNTWQPPPRRPLGPQTAVLLGIDGAVSFPFSGNGAGSSQNNLSNLYGVGGGFGVDIGLRFARAFYVGALAQGSFFGNNNGNGNGGTSFALGAVLGVMSNPEGVGFYAEAGGALRTISINSGAVPAATGTQVTGDVILGIGLQFKIQSFRFIPKLDLFVGPDGFYSYHGFFTLGISGFWELPLDRPPPPQNTNATPPPPPAY